MSIFDRLFSGKKANPQLALPELCAAIQAAVPVLEHAEMDSVLLRARLADLCRDAQVAPLSPTDFDKAARELDVESWRRLAVLVAASDRDMVRGALLAALVQHSAANVVTPTCVLAREKSRLTLPVLRKSALRVEELSRAWLAHIGIDVTGETGEQSRAALERLDYERVLQQAEIARKAAEARMEYLKQAQDADDAARAPRRGKS